VVIAAGISSEELRARVAQDPFVVEGVVTPEIIELDTTMSDPRLAFWSNFTGNASSIRLEIRAATSDVCGLELIHPRRPATRRALALRIKALSAHSAGSLRAES
jgi:hypothetical protein